MNVLAVAAGWVGPPCGDRKFFYLVLRESGSLWGLDGRIPEEEER